MPVEPTSYQQFWRAPGIKTAVPIVATVLMGLVFVALSTIIVLAAIFAGGVPDEAALEALTQGSLSPTMVLANSISIALVLPMGFLVVRLMGQRPGYLSSVVGRFRWGFFFRCVGVTAAVFLVYSGISVLIDGVDSLGLGVRDYTWWLLIGLMLVTPFQAAAEEYLLRGFVLRTVGSWFAAPLTAALVGGLVNCLIFMGLHASTDLWLNLVYFSMGAVGTYLAWRTGGLEGAVAIHIVNNMIGMALLSFQDMEAQFDRAAGAGGPEVLLQIATTVAAGALILWVAKRQRIVTVGPPERVEPTAPAAPTAP
ncbi:hypothetical protein BW730_02435 [Tessaracoccus aquimaris]|uniref:CAAX prenyl protease 2/Lysostaphin resistance protein A-like domain-containing protein n=1 Tax=Tessaracoccus aquimaris TaxID=1332264 RepID=A0A1Q2CKA4_9ACTN|nr:type II CAAX endopeptidase family protein [Tessaracoccus aquimaris]AQP46566.1 hypothetical protein BW730_02435 [Tessaracoccus aquimaris]